LAGIENRHRLEDQKDKNKPTLRRTAGSTNPNGSGNGNGSGSSTDNGNGGDDRPTLHRRDGDQ